MKTNQTANTKMSKASTGFTSAILLTSLLLPLQVSAHNHGVETITYEDLFHLEYAANPIVMPSGESVLYERRSMDIMSDSQRINLWTVDVDGSNHMPLMSSMANYSSAVFSPDGSSMAYLSSKEGKTQIYVRDVESGRTARVTDLAMSPSGLSFSPDGKQLAFSMFTPKQQKPIFNIGFKPKGAEWAEEAHYIDQTSFQRDGAGMNRPGNMHVYVVPAFGGTPRQISEGEHDFSGTLMWTKDAKQIVVSANTHEDSDFDIFNSDLIALDVASGEMTVLTDATGPESNPILSPNGEMIAFTGFVDNGKSNQINHIYVMDVDGTNVRDLTPDLDRSAGDIQWSENGRNIYFSYDDHGKKLVASLSLSGDIDVKTDALGGQSIGRPYTSGDFDVSDDGSVVFTQSTGVSPADLAIVTRRGKLTQLTDLNSDIFAHKTMNSTGTEFANLIDKNYPSEDYNDLIDMVDGVIAKGYVDENNLFVTGGSGGGVLTAWIIGNTDRFKAAVVAKPVINWISMIGTSDIYAFMTRYWFTDLPWNDIDQYWKRSPLSLVGNVNTPTMVLTGELDVRTPMAESEQYYGALRLEGVESSLVRIQGAYHGIAAKPSNLARKIGYILAWFDKYKDEKYKEEKK